MHEYLDQHPNICMSKVKEPHIYSNEEKYNKRFNEDKPCSFDTIFKCSNKNIKYYGEASTTYFLSKEAPQRIFHDTPDAKFILILRDPIERIISHYNWLYGFKVIEKEFIEEIKDWENKPFIAEESFNGNYKNYIAFSEYGKQLANYLNYFKPEQFHIIETNDLKKNPLATINGCFRFLGLPELTNIAPVEKNRTKNSEIVAIPGKVSRLLKIIPKKLKRNPFSKRVKSRLFIKELVPPPVGKQDVEWLKSRLREDMILLGKLTGKKFTTWKHF